MYKSGSGVGASGIANHRAKKYTMVNSLRRPLALSCDQ
jgi:hypothetical protein